VGWLLKQLYDSYPGLDGKYILMQWQSGVNPILCTYPHQNNLYSTS
jgi:hypothetical protein